MWLPDNGKFSSKFKYIELARYVPGIDRLTREQYGKDKPKIYEWSDVDEYRTANNNRGVYSSVFHYNARDLAEAMRLGSLYFDLDSSDDGVTAYHDAKLLVQYLRDHIPDSAMRVYFTGAKGFHVECEALPLGINPSNELPHTFRYIANQLKDSLGVTTLDFHVYDLRRMWRIPHSQHQKTGLFKVDLGADRLLNSTIEQIKEYASDPHFEEAVPEQKFSAQANEWYREWQYRHESKEEITSEQMIARFAKFGSSLVVKEDPNSTLEFDPQRLFESCPVLMKHWERAEQEHDLPHEIRLFLCSLLTYNEEAIWYLHSILQNCDDYSPERTDAHIKDWVRRRELGIGGRPYTCERANQSGFGCGNCELKPKEKLQRVGGKLIKTGEFSSPSPLRFGYYRRKHEEKEDPQSG